MSRKIKVTSDDFGPLEEYVAYAHSQQKSRACKDCGRVHYGAEEHGESIVELPSVDADQPSERDTELFRQMQYHLQQSRYHMQQAKYHKEQIKRLASITPEVCYPQGAVCMEDNQCCGGRCVDGHCVSRQRQ
jgi:hypothetical protein